MKGGESSASNSRWPYSTLKFDRISLIWFQFEIMVELSIGRDSLGFEDIDEFWNADGTVNSSVCFSSSKMFILLSSDGSLDVFVLMMHFISLQWCLYALNFYGANSFRR